MSAIRAPMLTIRGLVVKHGEIEALHDVSLDVGEGEIVAVIGPNGAGKTSLLRTVAGALRAARGSIVMDGRPIAGAPAWRVVRHGIALVPEGRRIFADQTVRANLELGAVSHGRFDDLPRVLARFPALRERLEQPAGALSGGQQQMLAIARGLMAEPRLIMLDEPSLGLAPALVVEIFRMIAGMRALGLAILLSEQNARSSLAIADRAYVIEQGRVALQGSGRELLGMSEVAERYLGVGKSVGALDEQRHQHLVGRLKTIFAP